MTLAPSRSILVPLDGSPFAEQALPLAIEIAKRTNAILQLALVHHPVPALAMAIEVPEIETTLDTDSREREHSYVVETAHRLHLEQNIPVSGVVLDGTVVEAICSHVDATGVDLVVSTTHGRGLLSRFWLGSVADLLMRRLQVPVLLIRPRNEPGTPGGPSIARILVALDGSPFAEQALESAEVFARAFEARLELIFVVEPPPPIADPSGLMVIPAMTDAEKILRRNAEEYLERVAGRLRANGLQVSCAAIDGPTAAATILAEAEKRGADLIALATHGAGGLERLVVGSVADKVIRGSNMPVLVVRPQKH